MSYCWCAVAARSKICGHLTRRRWRARSWRADPGRRRCWPRKRRYDCRLCGRPSSADADCRGELVAPAAVDLVATINAQQAVLSRALQRSIERAQQRIDYVLRLTTARRAPWKLLAGQLEELRLRSGNVLVEAMMQARVRVSSRVHRLLVARPTGRRFRARRGADDGTPLCNVRATQAPAGAC